MIRQINKPNNLRTAKSVWKLLKYSININCIIPLIQGKHENNNHCYIPDWQKQSLEIKSIIPLKDSVIKRFNRQKR